MRIAVLSDIHDNVWKLAAALEAVGDADALICCGDLCSPFIVHQLGRGFSRPIHVVLGNNDGDLYRITANARQYEHMRIHGELFRGEFDGRRVAVNHYDNIARAIAALRRVRRGVLWPQPCLQRGAHRAGRWPSIPVRSWARPSQPAAAEPMWRRRL